MAIDRRKVGRTERVVQETIETYTELASLTVDLYDGAPASLVFRLNEIEEVNGKKKGLAFDSQYVERIEDKDLKDEIQILSRDGTPSRRTITKEEFLNIIESYYVQISEDPTKETVKPFAPRRRRI